MPKTIDDVTKDEWVELAGAMQDLLECAMFMLWMGGHENDPDTSYVKSINRAADALRAVGLEQDTIPEYIANLEAMLHSRIPPDQWRMLRDAKGKKQ